MKICKRSLLLLLFICTFLVLVTGCAKKNYYKPDDNSTAQGYNAAVIKAITLEQEQLELNVGEAVLLNPTVTPDNARNNPVKWKSSDERILEVNQQGVVFAKQPGKGDITVSDESGGVKTVCHITVGSLRKAVFSGMIPNHANPGQTFNVKVKFENCIFPSVKVVAEGGTGSISSDSGSAKFSESREQTQMVGNADIIFTVSSKAKESNLRVLCYDNGVLFDCRDYNIAVVDEAAEKAKLKEEIMKEILESLKNNKEEVH
jgi:hypothetical protein